ncbi:MAG: hypothetical protein FJ109_12635 [Deltaproteobacteria bacterium]|nr:hypothetical protein [Deltaproteobacteria bacterium]
MGHAILKVVFALLLAVGCSGGNGGSKLPGDSTGGNETALDLAADVAVEIPLDGLGAEGADGPGDEPDLCAGCECNDSCGLDVGNPEVEVPACGNGQCEAGEDASTCPQDCELPPACGNGQCEAGEDASTCPQDCEIPPGCGDATCAEDENCATCPDDCGDCCGNGACDAGETKDSCPQDCADACGDGVCSEGEDWTNCLSDCPNPCGDGACGPSEECNTCPQDCGACPGTPFCVFFGKAGDKVSCPVELAAADVNSPKAVGLQFKLGFDPAKVEFVKFHDELCTAQDNCMDWDIPPYVNVVPTGHNLAYTSVADGLVKVILYHGSDPTKALSGAWLVGGQVHGDPWLFDVVFKLTQDVAAGDGAVTVDELVATDQEANPLDVELDGSLLVTQ